MPKQRTGDVSPEKARQILHEGKANGKDLTPRQRRFFGARASGYGPRRAEDGTIVVPADYGMELGNVVFDLPYVEEP